MKKAIIHIGCHKTGSTSIQKSLCDSSQNLLEQNILYPLELTIERIDFYGQHILAWNLLGEFYGAFGVTELEVQSSLENFSELIKHSDSDLIISSEDFVWLQSDAIEKLGKVLQSYEIYVVMYARRQDDATLALYQTDVVYAGQTLYFNDWLKDRSHGFDYMSIAERWLNSLGSKVIVRPYTRDRLTDGDVVADFESVINDIFERKVRLIRPTHDLNQTMPSNITSMIRYYNSQPVKEQIVPALRQYGAFLASKKIKSSFQLISSFEKNNILQHYYESNIHLSKKYLNSSEIWFEEMKLGTAEPGSDNKYQFGGGDLLEMIDQTMKIVTMKS